VGTEDEEYAARLSTLGGARWKQVLNVQAPYRWRLRRQHLGRTLDVGCGLGRNLDVLAPGSVGVDHNPTSIRIARDHGYDAYTVDEFLASEHAAPTAFDGMLLSHVIEHLQPADGLALMRTYLPFLRPGGRVLFICPQERGYASDETHVRWTTDDDLVTFARELGLRPRKLRSFPLPRLAGRWFTYNEFAVLAEKPD
jgi:SAM-dependent methyltransferase